MVASKLKTRVSLLETWKINVAGTDCGRDWNRNDSSDLVERRAVAVSRASSNSGRGDAGCDGDKLPWYSVPAFYWILYIELKTIIHVPLLKALPVSLTLCRSNEGQGVEWRCGRGYQHWMVLEQAEFTWAMHDPLDRRRWKQMCQRRGRKACHLSFTLLSL